jgi:hypothetical protein
MADFKDQALAPEVDALLGHRLLEVVHVHDTEAIVFNRDAQARTGFMH